MANTPKERTKAEKEEFLRKAHERFRVAAEAENDIRAAALDDIRFSSGEQWHDEDRKQRELKGRPCLTINRMEQFIRQVANDQRQNRPSIRVSPVDDKADIETAKVLQGLIRHIEYDSDADTAYDTAFGFTARGGFGYFRIITDYCSPTSFDQKIVIKRVRNPFSVYLDPFYQNIDGSDANYAFVIDDLAKDDFNAKYKDAEVSSFEDGTGLGDNAKQWISEKTYRVAEYFFKESEEVTVYLLSNGSVVEEAETKNLPEGITVVDKKKASKTTVHWAKITAADILEETIIPGPYIPIVPTLGDELEVDGKRTLKGVVRDAKDAQRIYNYQVTNEAEMIALAPKAPWIGVEGQFEGHEDKWATANTETHAYLEVKPKSIGGMPAPMPQRNAYEPPIQAITQARQLAAEDMKATTGIYDAALGARSNETSGVAIRGRQAQAQTSNFHLVDNLSKSIRHGGRIIINMIPKVYDAKRTVRTLGEDGSEELVAINQIFEKDGQSHEYDFSIGEYDVAVDTGPSFATKRQEAVASISDMTRSWPQLMQFAGDIMVKNMDWPGAQDIAERLKLMLPPQLQQQSKDQPPIPPQVQAQLAQQGKLIDDLTKHLNQKTQQIDSKTLELESKERIATMQMKMDAEIALARLQTQGSIELLAHEVQNATRRVDQLGGNVPMGAVDNQPPQPAGPMPPQPQPQDLNGAGPQGLAPDSNQQPTGGPSPG